MTRALSAALAVVVGLVALSGCGSTGQGSIEQAGRSQSPTAPPPPSTSTSTTAPTKAPTKADRTVGLVRVKGTVSDGVEPGCRLLRAKGVVYLLIWSHGTLATGKVIEVEGMVRPDLITTCQQGVPLAVQRVRIP